MEDKSTELENSYSDSTRAESYAKLKFPNTYYLAYRDLPEIIAKHVSGNKAIDFGCGTGRSSRFLKKLDFSVIGIDISSDMIEKAAKLELSGDYRVVTNGRYEHLGLNEYDLVLSVFTFDNIPGWDNRINILSGLRDLLKSSGRMICLDSTPELYVNECASFTTMDFPENREAKTGDIVRCIMRDVEDQRPVEDVFWSETDYHKLFEFAGFEIEAVYKPLGYEHEPFAWISEKEIAPWIIFVLKKKYKKMSSVNK